MFFCKISTYPNKRGTGITCTIDGVVGFTASRELFGFCYVFEVVLRCGTLGRSLPLLLQTVYVFDKLQQDRACQSSLVPHMRSTDFQKPEHD